MSSVMLSAEEGRRLILGVCCKVVFGLYVNVFLFFVFPDAINAGLTGLGSKIRF